MSFHRRMIRISWTYFKHGLEERLFSSPGLGMGLLALGKIPCLLRQRTQGCSQVRSKSSTRNTRVFCICIRVLYSVFSLTIHDLYCCGVTADPPSLPRVSIPIVLRRSLKLLAEIKMLISALLSKRHYRSQTPFIEKELVKPHQNFSVDHSYSLAWATVHCGSASLNRCASPQISVLLPVCLVLSFHSQKQSFMTCSRVHRNA